MVKHWGNKSKVGPPSSTYHITYEEFLPKYLTPSAWPATYQFIRTLGQRNMLNADTTGMQTIKSWLQEMLQNTTSSVNVLKWNIFTLFWVEVSGWYEFLELLIQISPPITRRNHSTAEAGRGQRAHLEAAEWSQRFSENPLCLGLFWRWLISIPWETPQMKPSWRSALKAVEHQVIWELVSSPPQMLRPHRKPHAEESGVWGPSYLVLSVNTPL